MRKQKNERFVVWVCVCQCALRVNAYCIRFTSFTLALPLSLLLVGVKAQRIISLTCKRYSRGTHEDNSDSRHRGWCKIDTVHSQRTTQTHTRTHYSLNISCWNNECALRVEVLVHFVPPIVCVIHLSFVHVVWAFPWTQIVPYLINVHCESKLYIRYVHV